MFRDRLKSAAKKAALKVLGMEWDAENTSVGPPKATGGPVDLSRIPRVVDGAGDTPGPNHRTNIGRTWLAAQVASVAGPLLVDIRPPKECVNGMLPGALLLPGTQLKQNTHRLPAKTERIVIYDQIGGEDSAKLAEWLRQEGWDGARKLVGGFAEWIEHDEPVARPEPPAGGRFHVGTPAERVSGGRGFVQWAEVVDGKVVYTLLLDDGTVVGPLPEEALKA